MPRKCPPGVICIENVTIFFMIAIVAIAIIIVNNTLAYSVTKETVYVNQPTLASTMQNSASFFNPLAPPLRDNRVHVQEYAVPINISTRAVSAEYRQVGILTRVGGIEMILPLFGKPLIVARDKWNFYTMSDNNSMIKLPVSFKGRSCTNEYGCDNIYNGDSVYVEGYNDTFKVTMYDTNTMQYIPYL